MEREVTVDGLRIRYLEEGSGMPVIMLHGASLGSSADVFERHLGPLSDAGFRAVAYDQPGFGLSDAAEDYTLAYRTGFLPRFMSAIDAEQAALIGHSQAGGIVVETALDHPDRVAKVLVVCSGSLLQGLPGFSPPAHTGSEATDAPPTLEDSRKLLESNLYHKELITPEVLEKRHSLSLGRNLETFLERQRVVEPKRTGPRLWERLMEVRAPDAAALRQAGPQPGGREVRGAEGADARAPAGDHRQGLPHAHVGRGRGLRPQGGRFPEGVTRRAPAFGQPADASP